MKKLFVLATALLIVGISVSVMAQDIIIAPKANAKIWTRSAFGSGLAIYQSDPMDFELIRIGIAGVKFVSGENETIVKAGILHFGETKYRLRDVVIGNGSATANIYYNDSQVGTIAVDSYAKGDREVWAGTLTLNDKTYNTYIIQVPKIMRAVEKAERTFEYCKNNPVRCRAVMKAVGNIICNPEAENVSCRDKIKTFCEEHPDDRRCKALRLAYCKIHLEDSTCRAEIMGVCQNNATENACSVLGTVYNKNIEKRPEALTNAPEWFKTVRERLRQAIGG